MKDDEQFLWKMLFYLLNKMIKFQCCEIPKSILTPYLSLDISHWSMAVGGGQGLMTNYPMTNDTKIF